MTGAIALAAGGTGGHMFPAEALAEELRRRNWRILLVTDARGRRYAERFPADERFEISAASPSIGGPAAKALAALSLAGGLVTALREFRKRDIAAAVGFGGYPSFPAMKAAALLKIPYVVHEQNGVLGRANRLLASGATFTAHAFPALERAPARAHLREVGNPLRGAAAALAGAPYSAPSADGPINLLIFGGSQGAKLFSKIVPPAIAALPKEIRRRLNIVQQTREEESVVVAAIYKEAGVEAELAPFFPDLPARMAKAHLVIARAGASTVTEIATIGRPSILVPLAIAMDDHQTGNALVLVEGGAAMLLPEKDFTVDALKSALAPLLIDPSRLAEMAAAAKGRVRQDAAASLADLVEEIARRRDRKAA
ncbi:MAG TPA: UDP-N-acetylglucosamine--N-acetylmuramyl-(pentapeptide) pyrophosphoryl-undecaprenol N-acetylglucosamine transferase [Parvularculaceae bacterium]|nr:UDP-N-acetylglucosamine--N-acetylmuramyl-(pentapeptide) pyrophosphoryl-undecaprenol N-acetylglucosamine transferase [Parvularculaceae bacterium]